jgi:hypothetical protein
MVSTAAVGAGGFLVQFGDQIDVFMKIAIGLLSIAYLLMQMFYKWRSERRKGNM